VGHRCVSSGRRFVHLIFFNGDHLVSLAITRKGDTTFPHEEGAAAAETRGIPLYHARLRDTLELEVAGFETRDYLVFLVSEPRDGGNLRVARTLASDLTGFLDGGGMLRTVRTRGEGSAFGSVTRIFGGKSRSAPNLFQVP